MPRNHDKAGSEPLVQIFEDLASPQLHTAAWATCMSDGWRFGHGSVEGGGARFWRMELREDAAFLAIWEQVRGRCEALADGPLRVVQLYANGHTYGMGGNVHRDDSREGTFTLLYYPNPEWNEDWDGQTLFYDAGGEIALSVRLRPNRAVFFDSRIPHRGTAPSRCCTGLRVSVAYKLERVEAAPARPGPGNERAAGVEARSEQAAPGPAQDAVPGREQRAAPAELRATVQESAREGAKRTYTASVDEPQVLKAVEERLLAMGQNIKLPGFRPGKIPFAVLDQRYGGQARFDTLRQLTARIIERGLPAGSVAGSCELVAGETAGAMEVRIHATHLPDLPGPALSNDTLRRISAEGITRDQIREAVLDDLDAAFAVPLFPRVVEKEYEALWRAAEEQQVIPSEPEEREAMSQSLREIAERRLRLGLILAEFARRFGIPGESGAEVEDRTIDRLVELSGNR